jgi:RND family efflux transporter MFP subunit
MPIKTSLFSVLTALALLAGCEQANEYVAPPPPGVTVAQPLQQDVTEYLEFTGTTRPFEDVEVRARVAGFLESMHFTPGTQVERGELLFVIDPREYEANVNAARAELESAKAALERANIELARADKLFKQQAGTEVELVKWRGERKTTEAAVLRAESQLERANLDLEYTQVTAPISGRVSRNLEDVGNLVGEGEPTLLTTITNTAPMYAYFNLNERDLLRAYEMYRVQVRAKGIDVDQESTRRVEVPLELGLASEQGYPHPGQLDFAESSVDPDTGTLQLRGVFPNKEQPPVLLPGLFVRIRMPIEERADALLVTERAIAADQGGRYLLTVNGENTVEKRPIRQGQLVDGLRVIEEGVSAGESVVVVGVQRARPGAEVNPEQVEMAALTASALRAAAQAEQEKGQAADEPPAPTESPAAEPQKD